MHSITLKLISGLLLACLLVATSWGQSDNQVNDESASITPSDQGDGKVTLNFAEADIGAFIAAISQITGKNFIVDPRVKGRITVISGTPLPPESLYDVFLSVLEIHNSSAIEAGDVTKIVPSAIVKQIPTPTSTNLPINSRDEQITQIYQLKHGLVQELVPILRPLLPPTSHFATHNASNTLIITDTSANIQRVLDIISNIDQPDRRSDVYVISLKFAKAANLAQILSQLANSIQLQPSAGGAPVPQVGNKVTVQAEPTTNSLIIQAPESEFITLRAVIDQLDIEKEQKGSVHVLYLKHANAVDLASVLTNLITTQPGAADVVSDKVPVSVLADEQTNALIVRAAEDDFAEISQVIGELDIQRAQVYVETIIAEITQGKEAELGVEWSATGSTSPFGRVGTISTDADAAFDGSNIGASDVVIDGQQVTGDTSFSNQTGGATIGFVNSLITDITGGLVPDLSVILRALRSDANTNILSTPNLLTLDNEEAEIVVGQEVPFITGQFVSDANTNNNGDGDQNNVVNPFQTIERKDVGIKLKIKPQINEGDVIRLEIDQEISNVSRTTLQGASDLITDNRSIKTTVQVEDGQIIVLGGLVRDSLVDTVEWVPVLGKIPLIGALFRKKGKSSAKTNLMIFLRPKVIRSHQDLVDLTRRKYQYIQEKEKSGQPDTKTLIREVDVPKLSEVDWNNKGVEIETPVPVDVPADILYPELDPDTKRNR